MAGGSFRCLMHMPLSSSLLSFIHADWVVHSAWLSDLSATVCCSLSGDEYLLLLVAVEAYGGVAAGLGYGLQDALLLLRVESALAVEVAVIGGLALTESLAAQYRLAGDGHGADEGLEAVGPALGTLHEEVGATAVVVAH